MPKRSRKTHQESANSDLDEDGSLELLQVGAHVEATVPGLDLGDRTGNHLLPLLLEGEHGLGILDEHLGVTSLELFALEAEGLHQLNAAVFAGALVVGPGLLGHDLVPLQEEIKVLSVAETGTTNPDVLEQTIAKNGKRMLNTKESPSKDLKRKREIGKNIPEVLGLMSHQVFLEVSSELLVVGLDGPDVVGLAFHQVFHELIDLFL